MTNDLTDLRALLHDRANVTPDVDALLTNVHAGAKRVRRRRRAAGLAGAAAITIGALTATSLLMHPDDQPTYTAAAAPTISTTTAAGSSPVGAPQLLFTVGWLPAGFTVSSWTVDTPLDNIVYTGPNDTGGLSFAIAATDPTTKHPPLDAQATTVNGIPAVLGRVSTSPAANVWQLSWQFRPGLWMIVDSLGLADSGHQLLRQAAAGVGDRTTILATSLDAPDAPDGWDTHDWVLAGNGAVSTITLCPENLPTATDATNGCVAVAAVTGVAPSDGAAQQTTVNGVVWEFIDNGRSMVRQATPNLYLLIAGVKSAPQSVIDEIATTVGAK